MSNITLKGNIPALPVIAGATEQTLQVQIPPGSGPSGSGGNGEGNGFIAVNVASSALTTWEPGSCTITISQP